MTLQSFWARHGTTAALLTLALGLGAFVLWDGRGGAAEPGDAPPTERLLGGWSEDAVTELVLSSSAGSFALARSSRDSGPERAWRLRVAGRERLADPQAVGQLLATLGLARAERAVDARGLETKTLGLEPPAWQLELTMAGRRAVVELGGGAPSPPGARYLRVRLGDEPPRVVVVSQQLAAALEQSGPTLESHALLPAAVRSLARITLREPTGVARWTLERAATAGRGVEGFVVGADAAGARVRADWRVVQAMAVVLEELAVAAPLDTAPAADAVAWALELEPAAGTGQRVRLEARGPCPTAPDERLLVRTEPAPLAGCVPADAFDRLSLPRAALVDTSVVGAAEASVIEVKLGAGPRAVEVARRDEGWHLRLPRDEQADRNAVDRWLAELLALRGELVPLGSGQDLAGLGLEPPTVVGRVVSLGSPSATGDAAAERIEQLAIGAVRDGFVHVRRGEDGVVLRLREEAVQTLLPDGTLFRSPAIVAEGARTLLELRIEAGQVRQRLERTPDGSSWLLREPMAEGLAADPTLAGQLAELLSELRVQRWVAATPDRAFGLEPPRCTIAARYVPADGADDAGAQREASEHWVTLRVGDPTAGGSFAQLEGDGAVFVAPPLVVELGCSWLLDRGALLVDPATVTRVTLTGAGAGDRLIVEPRADGWQVVAGKAATSDAAERARVALGSLMAEAVVCLGPAAAAEQLAKPRLTIDVERAAGSGPQARAALRLLVGASDTWRDTRIFFVRRADRDVTYAVAHAKLRPLLELF